MHDIHHTFQSLVLTAGLKIPLAQIRVPPAWQRGFSRHPVISPILQYDAPSRPVIAALPLQADSIISQNDFLWKQGPFRTPPPCGESPEQFSSSLLDWFSFP